MGWRLLLCSLCFCLASVNSYARQYQWQSVSFLFDGKAWRILTDRTVKGVRLVHLRYLADDGYPLNIVLGLVPKKLKGANIFEVKRARSANVLAVDFAWPIIKRFAKANSKEQALISFNEVTIANQPAAGALMIVPTPKPKIYVSAQNFYLNAADYYILGTVITRIDKGTMRVIDSYAQRLARAYGLLKALKISP